MKKRLILILLAAYLLAACRTATVGPATATARAQRVIAQATDMAVQAREGTIQEIKQATATAQARMDRLALLSSWPVVLSDSFDDNANEWSVGQETGDYADISFTIANGVFRWEATSRQGFVWWNSPTISSVTDFYLAADARQVNGPASSYVGLVLHLDDNGDHYLFSMRNSGDYSFDEYYNGQWINFIPWTPSSAIRVDETNHMEVISESGSFSFFVNGEWLADYEDQGLPAGYSGLLVGMDEVDESAVWEFDNFELRGTLAIEENPTPEATIQP